jgi:hypothetical protein
MSPRTAFHFSALAVSGLMSLTTLSLMAITLWIVSRAVGQPVAFWSAPDWVLASMAIGIAFLPGVYIDRKVKAFRVVGSDIIALYSTQHQRRLSLFTILSVVPLATVAGLCFASIRAMS